MPRAGTRLTKSQAKRLEIALRRRGDGHARVEGEWVKEISDLVASGVAVKAVAGYLRVSRQTIYDWLAKAGSR